MPAHPAIFEAEQLLPGNPNAVWSFFADPRNLERITPPWLRFRVLTPEPIELRAGTLIDYALRWRVFPIRWRTLISCWEPPHRFVDEQLRGPYRLWRHEHRFEAVGNRTLMTDRVEYRAPVAWISHPLMVRRDVERIFAYRRDTLDANLAWLRG